ncbi:MAG: S1 RNA-binding domain-containing protein [Chitinophagaceae bacterium]
MGVKQDGLIHISHLANRFVSNLNEAVKLGQKVMATVLEVDIARKRIALSLKDGGAVSREEGKTERKIAVKPAKPSPPLNPFQANLAELKKNLKE